jgi:hypothetical protein
MFQIAKLTLNAVAARFSPRAVRWGWIAFVAWWLLVAWGLWFAWSPVPRWTVPGKYWLRGFTPDRSAVVTISRLEFSDKVEPENLNLSIWDMATGEKRASVETFCSYHVYSANFRYVAAGLGEDFWIIDTTTGAKKSIPGSWRAQRWHIIRFAPAHGLMARHEDDTLFLIDAATGAILAQHNPVTTFYGFLPNSKQMVYSTQENDTHFLTIWEHGANPPTQTFGPYSYLLGGNLHGRFFPVRRKSATGDYIDLLDLRNQKTHMQIPDDARHWPRLFFSADDRLLALQRADRFVFWDLHTQTKIATTQGSTRCNSGIFSPDGSKFAAKYVHIGGGMPWGPRPFQMFDVNTGHEIWKTETPDSVRIAHFSADSRRLFLECDSTVTSYDTDSGAIGKSIRYFRDTTAFVSREPLTGHFAELSSDQRYIYNSASAKQSVRIPGLFSTTMADLDEIAFVDLKREQRILLHLQTSSFLFCDEGPTLVTIHESAQGDYLAAWDFPPRKPWLTIVGVTFGLALLSIGLKKAYRRLRRARKLPVTLPIPLAD